MMAVWTSCGGRQGEEDLELQFGSQIKRRCCESSVGTEITHINRCPAGKTETILGFQIEIQELDT